MKKTNWMRFGAVAALAAGMAFATPAPINGQAPAGQQNHATWQQRRARFHERMARELNLTPAQQQQAKAIFGKAREDARPIRQELRQNREALAAAVKTDNLREIHNLTAKAATLRAQMMEMRLDAAASFYKTLTPAQRAKADQLHQQMRERWQQRHQQNEHPAS